MGVVWDCTEGRLTFKVASDFLNCQEPIELFDRWLFTRGVYKILVDRWFEVNSGIPLQSKFDSTVDFPFKLTL